MILGLGIRAFRQGNTKLSQRMMRARVFAQGFTIVVVGYSAFHTTRAHQRRIMEAQAEA